MVMRRKSAPPDVDSISSRTDARHIREESGGRLPPPFPTRALAETRCAREVLIEVGRDLNAIANAPPP